MSIKIQTPAGIAPKAAAAQPTRRPGPQFRQPVPPARQFARQPAHPAASSGQQARPGPRDPRGRQEHPVSGFRAPPVQPVQQALLALLAQVQPGRPGRQAPPAPPGRPGRPGQPGQPVPTGPLPQWLWGLLQPGSPGARQASPIPELRRMLNSILPFRRVQQVRQALPALQVLQQLRRMVNF